VKALVVDDSMAMRRMVQKALESAGWAVKTGANGHEALEALDAGEGWDLVVTDWHMPGMDGIQLTKAIRQSPRHAALKVIMVTSEAMMTMVDAALTAGVNDFLMKPFTADSLCERVAEIVNG
jgi:two-component system chemotaxis response regulator CheY